MRITLNFDLPRLKPSITKEMIANDIRDAIQDCILELVNAQSIDVNVSIETMEVK